MKIPKKTEIRTFAVNKIVMPAKAGTQCRLKSYHLKTLVPSFRWDDKKINPKVLAIKKISVCGQTTLEYFLLLAVVVGVTLYALVNILPKVFNPADDTDGYAENYFKKAMCELLGPKPGCTSCSSACN